MLGLLGLRIFEACGASVEALCEEHGHRVLKVRGKGSKVVLPPLPPAVQRTRRRRTRPGTAPAQTSAPAGRMDRHAATRRLKHLADDAGVTTARMHPHMLRHHPNYILAAHMASGT